MCVNVVNFGHETLPKSNKALDQLKTIFFAPTDVPSGNTKIKSKNPEFGRLRFHVHGALQEVFAQFF